MQREPRAQPPEHGTMLELGAPLPRQFTRTRADVERWRHGDRDAFAELWQRYRPGLEVLVGGRLRAALDPGLRPLLDTDDVLQEVAMLALARVADFSYRGQGSVFAWLAGIAHRVVLDRAGFLRAGKRNGPRQRHRGDTATGEVGASADPLSAVAAGASGAATAAAMKEQRLRVARALADLGERDHTIVLWRFFGGATWAEIAAEIGAPSPDAVRVECFARVLPALALALRR